MGILYMIDMENSSIDECQEFVKNFVKERNWETAPNEIVIHMTEEMGEIARAVLKYSEYGGNHQKIDENFGEELADMFYLLLKLSNTLNLKLSGEFIKKMESNKKRFPAKA